MTLCNARVGERRKVNKEVRFSKKRITYPLMPEYAAGLKVPNCLNLSIDITRYAQVITASLAIKRSVSVRE